MDPFTHMHAHTHSLTLLPHLNLSSFVDTHLQSSYDTSYGPHMHTLE